MSNFRYVGSVPDHVTRYTHKQNRWMTPPQPYHRTTSASIGETIILTAAVAVLIVTAVMLLQAV